MIAVKPMIQNMSVREAAKILGVDKERIYGMIQAGIVDFGTYYRKPNKVVGSYTIPIGRFANYLCIPIEDLIKMLEEMREGAA